MLCINSLYPQQRSDAGLELQPIAFRSSQVLILFDTSESTGIAQGSGTRTSAMADAIKEIVDAYQERIAFGLMLFPDAPSCSQSAAPGCCVGAPSIGLGAKQGAAIRAALDNRPLPQGSSPMNEALLAASSFFQLQPYGGESRLILLVTDGQPGCGVGPRDASASSIACEESKRTVASLAKLNPPIRTLVLSPGPGDPVGKADCLLDLAEAAAANQNRDASIESDGFTTADLKPLKSALEATFVPEQASEPSCEIVLDPDPSPKPNFSVFIDGSMIPEDGDNGWKLETTNMAVGDAKEKKHYTVSLTGEYCSRLRQYRYNHVDVHYDCPIARLDGAKNKGRHRYCKT